MTPAADAADAALPPRRRWFIHTVILFLLGMSGLAIFCQREMWPFSHYPMYNRVWQPGLYATYQLVGVPGDDSAAPTNLLQERHHAPLGTALFQSIMGRLEQRPHLLQPLLKSWLACHDQAGQAGPHGNSRLAELRLVRCDYRLDCREPVMRQPLQSRTIVSAAREKP